AERVLVTCVSGRARGMWHERLVDSALPPYAPARPAIATHTRGDVAARVSVRFDEVAESMRLIRVFLRELPAGEIRVALAASSGGGRGVGWVEGWRGEVLIALETTQANRIHRAHPHDPSWQNWPLLEPGVMGNSGAD